jgi:hypothetical protein
MMNRVSASHRPLDYINLVRGLAFAGPGALQDRCCDGEKRLGGVVQCLAEMLENADQRAVGWVGWPWVPWSGRRGR